MPVHGAWHDILTTSVAHRETSQEPEIDARRSDSWIFLEHFACAAQSSLDWFDQRRLLRAGTGTAHMRWSIAPNRRRARRLSASTKAPGEINGYSH